MLNNSIGDAICDFIYFKIRFGRNTWDWYAIHVQRIFTQVIITCIYFKHLCTHNLKFINTSNIHYTIIQLTNSYK